MLLTAECESLRSARGSRPWLESRNGVHILSRVMHRPVRVNPRGLYDFFWATYIIITFHCIYIVDGWTLVVDSASRNRYDAKFLLIFICNRSPKQKRPDRSDGTVIFWVGHSWKYDWSLRQSLLKRPHHLIASTKRKTTHCKYHRSTVRVVYV